MRFINVNDHTYELLRKMAKNLNIDIPTLVDNIILSSIQGVILEHELGEFMKNIGENEDK